MLNECECELGANGLYQQVLYEVITGLPPYSTTKKKDLVGVCRDNKVLIKARAIIQ